MKGYVFRTEETNGLHEPLVTGFVSADDTDEASIYIREAIVAENLLGAFENEESVGVIVLQMELPAAYGAGPWQPVGPEHRLEIDLSEEDANEPSR